MFLAPQARAQLLPSGLLLACWDAMQRSAKHEPGVFIPAFQKIFFALAPE